MNTHFDAIVNRQWKALIHITVGQLLKTCIDRIYIAYVVINNNIFSFFKVNSKL